MKFFQVCKESFSRCTLVYVGSKEELSKCGLDGSIYATLDKVGSLCGKLLFCVVHMCASACLGYNCFITHNLSVVV